MEPGDAKASGQRDGGIIVVSGGRSPKLDAARKNVLASGMSLTSASDQTALSELVPAQSGETSSPQEAELVAATQAKASSDGREYSADEQMMSIAQLCVRFGTSINEADIGASAGLSAAQVSSLLVSHGRNVLTPPKTTPEWIKFLKQFSHLLLVLLEIAAALAFLGYGLNGDINNLILGAALIILVAGTGTMSYLQDRSAGNVINSIQGMLPSQCRVVRGGKEFLAPASDLVPGDLVHLTIGSRVPADIRIIQSSDFKVEMASLTGESDAIECGPQRKSDRPAEARNLIFNSTLVMNGECRGIVYKTGDDTMIGSIAGLAGTTSTGTSTMEREVLRVVHFISILAVITAFIFFGIGMGRGLGVVFSFVNAFVLVLIANVPEGLPATVTSILNLTAQTLAKRNIFIKRTELIETLGSATVICSDKTGTLTQNRMTVENMWIGQTFHRARGEIRRVPLGKTNSASGAPSPRSTPYVDPLAGMTVGRGMTFLSLPSGAPIAVVHNVTQTGGMSLRNRSDDLSALTVRSRDSMKPLAVLDATGLRRPTVLAKGSVPSLPPRSAAALASAFQDPGTDHSAEPSASGTPVVAKKARKSVTMAFAVPPSLPARIEHEHEHEEGKAQDPVPLPAQVPEVEHDEHGKEHGAVARPAAGATGSDLVLTGFSGPLMEMEGTFDAPSKGVKLAVTVERLGVSNKSPRLAASGSPMDSASTAGAVEGDVALSIPQWGSKTDSTAGIELAVPSKAKSLVRAASGQGSFMQHVSFQSFRGFTKVNWGNANAFSRVCTIAAVCNRAQFSQPHEASGPAEVDNGGATAAPSDSKPSRRQFPPGVDARTVLGDASEAALLRYVDGLAPIFEWRSAYPVLFDIPFNSTNKWAYCITRLPEDGHAFHLAMIKGAPERIIERCSHHFVEGVEVPIDDEYRRQWAAAYERFGIMGERVLGFAYAKVAARDPQVYAKDDTSYPMHGFVFAGLVSLVDPPKPGTLEAVEICKGAGIRVAMVTGDHPLTAEAIARKVGIITLPTPREVAASLGVAESTIAMSDPRVGSLVLAGYMLPDLTPADWEAVVSKTEVVFARTSPQQKLQIVETYQKAGHIVAVTGDGTNDSPALKKADIGVSMGSASASDVAREAADMVIMDDNFASIVEAIAMGRTVFDNIKKTIAYTITHLWPELIPVFATLVFDVPIMISGLFILLVDCVTEQGPAISLTFEPAEASVMLRPPRNLKLDRMVDFPLVFYSYIVMGIAESLVCILAYFSVFMQAGVPLSLVAYHPLNWIPGAPPLDLPDGRSLSGDEQTRIYRMAVGAYFLNLVLCQGWHIWLTKTRRVSIFKHKGMLGNVSTLYGVGVAISAAIITIYTPGLQEYFLAYNVGGLMWLPHFLFLAFALTYTELVKAGARKEEAEGRRGWVTLWLAW